MLATPRGVELRQDLPELPLGDEEAVRLVVGPVDRHAQVVKERCERDYDLRVFGLQTVVLHDPGLDVGVDQDA